MQTIDRAVVVVGEISARWRVRRSASTPSLQYVVLARRPDGMPIPGSARFFSTWAGAMGYVNLRIAQARGRLDSPHD